MAKDWKVTQKALIAGVSVSTSFVLPNMEAGEVSAFCALLEGGYQVTEINEAMSDMTNAETNAATSNPVSYIGMYGEQNQSARIQAFGGGLIHFKNTVNGDEIKAVLGAVTPYPLVPTAKPQTISIRLSERTL